MKKMLIAFAMIGIMVLTISFSTNKASASESPKPKKVVVKSIKAKGPSKIEIKIKKEKNIKGYQIKYSTKKNMKKSIKVTLNENKVVLKRLKANTTYYVRVRAYKKNRGKIIYGKWSKKSKVKTKKNATISIEDNVTNENPPQNIGSDNNEHTHDFKKSVVNPTCTDNGYTKYSCTTCGYSYTDSEVAKTGHSYKKTSDTATCISSGILTETCSICGEKKNSTSEATGHDVEIEIQEATCGKSGYEKEVCRVCGEVISKKTISPSGNHSWTTKTFSDAAAESYYEGGRFEFARYSGFTEHNVSICTTCKNIDLTTVTLKYSDREAAEIMLEYVNELRREVYGTDEYDLVIDETLLELAKIRAEEISVDFSHNLAFTAENITEVCKTIEGHFKRWENSTGHYQNMINKDYKYFAYASYYNISKGSVLYGVQLFSENAYY